MIRTILGIGAHYDDCVFGIPGILLKAVEKGHRVVILSLIGRCDSGETPRAPGKRSTEDFVRLCAEYGVEMRFLGFSSMKLESTEENQRIVAEAVAEVGPDTAFTLWPYDNHAEHEAAAPLSKAALRHGDKFRLGELAPKPPRRLYMYDNGPRHTIGFEPNTFVDISKEWPRAIEWLGRLMALAANEEYDPEKHGPALRAKETLASYRGYTCGVDYAEALRSADAYPQEVV